MLAALDQTLADATRDKISYSEFADILLQAESDYRQERKTKTRIKAAKFTVRPAFEDFDFTAKRSITMAEIKEIYTSVGSMKRVRCCSSAKPASAKPSSPRPLACMPARAANRCST